LIHAIERHIVALSPPLGYVCFFTTQLNINSGQTHRIECYCIWALVFWCRNFCGVKLLGMALFARIFNLTRPALMQVRWFAGLYNKIMFYLNLIHSYLDQWPASQLVKKTIKSLIARVKAILRPV
jgi:hypothetical protein